MRSVQLILGLASIVVCKVPASLAVTDDTENAVDAETRNEVGSTRIVGGREAIPNEYPYQAGLVITLNDGRKTFCGGSLISPTWVLTAGHCAKLGKSIYLTLGAHNILKHETTQQKFQAAEKAPHPNYTLSEVENDIALVKLDKPATLNEHVQLARLPSSGRTTRLYTNEKATMTGWGHTSDSKPGMSPTLRGTQSSIIPNAQCHEKYSARGIPIRDSNICASGVERRGTCNGDSGGPLTVKDVDGLVTQVGVTSFGIKLGCEKTWPPVFTRVSSYLDWIQEVTGGGYEMAPVETKYSHENPSTVVRAL